MVLVCSIGMIVYFIKINLKEYTTPRSTPLTSPKLFVYLTETEQCLPPNFATSSKIGDPETCNCDVIVLSFRAKCKEDKRSHVSYLFDPTTHFASGRNALFFAALDRRPSYHYYIILDDDTVLIHNNHTPADMLKLSPYRAMEKWLLDYEPVIGVLDYKEHDGLDSVRQTRKNLCDINEASLVVPTAFYSGIFSRLSITKPLNTSFLIRRNMNTNVFMLVIDTL